MPHLPHLPSVLAGWATISAQHGEFAQRSLALLNGNFLSISPFRNDLQLYPLLLCSYERRVTATHIQDWIAEQTSAESNVFQLDFVTEGNEMHALNTAKLCLHFELFHILSH